MMHSESSSGLHESVGDVRAVPAAGGVGQDSGHCRAGAAAAADAADRGAAGAGARYEPFARRPTRVCIVLYYEHQIDLCTFLDYTID